MCDCAEEQERQERELRQRQRIPVVDSSQSSWWVLQWWSGSGSGHGDDSTVKVWFPILGSTAALMGLMALLYKHFNKLKALVWKTKPICDTKVKRKSSPEKIKICVCKD
ncbi:uncharacterized protein LOC125064272 [Vanessa atalanta]|uniref:uncharacterized protein LOC125064272 n=1 Tax=Vanessa atalanta TaxID=42275 RepID=UPI001FCD4244|nr:uncharacterized protein LOC125064272 [Vanessa atalanta]